MAEFVLDTAGEVPPPAGPLMWPHALEWHHLDEFEKGYIEALFFTDSAPGISAEEWQMSDDHDEGSIPGDVGFSDLAPATLLQILKDCREFKSRCVHVQPLMGKDDYPDERQAGHDFWYTRNHHGCGFWDGDWPEPHASDLTEAAQTFREVDSYLGDDGKVYLS